MEDWCKSFESRLGSIEGRLMSIESGNKRLIEILALGLLVIVGAVVGVKVI